MDVALFVSSLLLSLFRFILNAIDPFLSRLNIHLVEKPPSSVEKLLATIRAKSGSLPSLAQWQERLQLALDYLRTAEDLTPFGRWTCSLRISPSGAQCMQSNMLRNSLPKISPTRRHVAFESTHLYNRLTALGNDPTPQSPIAALSERLLPLRDVWNVSPICRRTTPRKRRLSTICVDE